MSNHKVSKCLSHLKRVRPEFKHLVNAKKKQKKKKSEGPAHLTLRKEIDSSPVQLLERQPEFIWLRVQVRSTRLLPELYAEQVGIWPGRFLVSRRQGQSKPNFPRVENGGNETLFLQASFFFFYCFGKILRASFKMTKNNFIRNWTFH